MGETETKCRGAGRPRCFETEEVLEQAGAVFWSKGYASTSLTDLTKATGLNKGSIYSTFGDKHSLFLKCLKRYLDQRLEVLQETLSHDDPKTCLLNVFTALEQNQCEHPSGCLALNTLTELGPHDAKARCLLDSHLAEVEKLIRAVLERGQRSGVFGEFPVELASRTLCSVILAMKARARSHQLDELDHSLGPFLLDLLAKA